MMNTKDKRIDDFLKFFRDILVQNPAYEISSRNVYHELVRLGVDKNERNYDVSHMFRHWTQGFMNLKNIDVFVDPNWSYFCQFTNKYSEVLGAKEQLKLYVPLDYAHLEHGANIIFDFLRRNNIPHMSKIGKNIRFDNIVIRLVDENDLNKLINFINSNQYIQEGLNPASPFAYNKDGLAMVCDGHLSYNSTVASYIELYFKERKRQNRLDYVSVHDFYNFVENYYNLAFIQKYYSEQKIYQDFGTRRIQTHDGLNNLKQVTKLIINSRERNFKFDDYLQHYRENLYPESVNKRKIDINYAEIEAMMNYMIHVMTYHFGSVYKAKQQIIGYITKGKSEYLTRELGLRSKVVNSSFKEDLLKLLRELNMDLEQYINYVVNKNTKFTLQGDKEQKLMFAISNTYEKYGLNQVIYAIRSLINDGVYNGFTNNNHGREYLMDYVTAEDVKTIIKVSLGLAQNVQTFSDIDLIRFFEEFCVQKSK